jgi:hypothetical protein
MLPAMRGWITKAAPIVAGVAMFAGALSATSRPRTALADPPTRTTTKTPVAPMVELSGKELDGMKKALAEAFAKQLGDGAPLTELLMAQLKKLGFAQQELGKLDGLRGEAPRPWSEVNLDGDAKKERLWVHRASEPAPDPDPGAAMGIPPTPRDRRHVAVLIWLDPSAKGYRVVGRRVVETTSTADDVFAIHTVSVRPSDGEDTLVEQRGVGPKGAVGVEVYSIARGKLETVLSTLCQPPGVQTEPGAVTPVRCQPMGTQMMRGWRWDPEAFAFQ